jgi:hypothetical protein
LKTILAQIRDECLEPLFVFWIDLFMFEFKYWSSGHFDYLKMGKVLEFNIKNTKPDNKLRSYSLRKYRSKHKRVVRGDNFKMKSTVVII